MSLSTTIQNAALPYLKSALLGTSPTLRDYRHATNIFRPNNYSLLPKSKNWFHIFFEIDPVAATAVSGSLNTAIANDRINWNTNNIYTLSVLAKTVKLPNFTFDIKPENQYNKWNLNVTKINYKGIDITFWDDTIDVVRGFWYAYYQYMVQDPGYVNFDATQQQGIPIPSPQWDPSTGNLSSIYNSSDNWGNNYGLDTINQGTSTPSFNRTNPFFRSIRIYQLNRAINSEQGVQYSEYVLVNPIITSFDHDMNDFSTSDPMTNKMAVDYETVLYNAGFVDDDEIASWDYVQDNFLDTTPSPLENEDSGSNQLLGVLSAGASLIAPILPPSIPFAPGVLSVLSSAQPTPLNFSPSNNMTVPTPPPQFGFGGLPPEQF